MTTTERVEILMNFYIRVMQKLYSTKSNNVRMLNSACEEVVTFSKQKRKNFLKHLLFE